MDGKKRLRSIYVTAYQKKKLVELVTQNPRLIKGRFSQDFSSRDCQLLWQSIGRECNSIPGARKTWKQWRKTWQDLRSKMKKKANDHPRSAQMFTPAEKSAMGLNVTSISEPVPDSEFVMLDESNYQISISNGGESFASHSDGDLMAEEESSFDFPPKEQKIEPKKLNNRKQTTNHLDNCAFNCDILTTQEQKKIQIKEDYLNFKKDYLTQKLQLLREQTEALKTIAKQLMKSDTVTQ